MRKRVMSLVLAAVMLLGLAPAALADSGRSRRESFMSVAESQLGYRENSRTAQSTARGTVCPDSRGARCS